LIAAENNIPNHQDTARPLVTTMQNIQFENLLVCRKCVSSLLGDYLRAVAVVPSSTAEERRPPSYSGPSGVSLNPKSANARNWSKLSQTIPQIIFKENERTNDHRHSELDIHFLTFTEETLIPSLFAALLIHSIGIVHPSILFLLTVCAQGNCLMGLQPPKTVSAFD
jgi:hypothetical protein